MEGTNETAAPTDVVGDVRFQTSCAEEVVEQKHTRESNIEGSSDPLESWAAMTARRRRDWPPWWNWPIELWVHAKERMEARPFTEVDLRRMMEEATNYMKARRKGRWIIETRHRSQRWHVIVQPDYDAEILDVVTAYAVKRKEP